MRRATTTRIRRVHVAVCCCCWILLVLLVTACVASGEARGGVGTYSRKSPMVLLHSRPRHQLIGPQAQARRVSRSSRAASAAAALVRCISSNNNEGADDSDDSNSNMQQQQPTMMMRPMLLSLRGGGSIFGLFGRQKSKQDDTDPVPEEDNDDDDEVVNELYELTAPTTGTATSDSDPATDAVEDADADAGGDDDDDQTTSYGAPSRTVEMKASSRHIFSGTSSSSFNPFKSISDFLPILQSERSQFLAMSTMMFLFIYVFTTVRDTKDSLVVSNCGAESIPFLKLYGVMPCAVLFIVTYSKLSNVLGREALFYVTLVPFFVFYVMFAYVLYPNRDAIHFLPKGVGGGAGDAAAAAAAPGPLCLIRYWSYSVYFIVSELWASAGVPLLFWQCVNDVTSLEQAKRFYPLLAVFGNVAPIVSGKVMSFLVSQQKSNDDVGFQSTLQSLATITAAMGLGIIALYNMVYDLADKRVRTEERERINKILTEAKEGDTIEVELEFNGKPPTKSKPTMRESLTELSKSWELKSMATMVICYNVCIELTEVLWKALLRRTYTNKSAYMDFMATFSQTVGWVTVFMQLIAPSIIRGLGWTGAALLVPLSMGGLAVWFFSSVAGAEEGGATLATALLIGTLQNVVSKVTKYSLFDPCKEMAYIPLGHEAKVKGKAAVEVFGARLGRSIGSASQQLLVLASRGSGIIQCAPQLGFLYCTALLFWSKAVLTLGELFDGPAKDDAEGQPSGLTGLIHVRLDSNEGEKKIVSIEAERGKY